MTYNLTQVANSSTMLEYFQNVNTILVDGWFGTMLLIGLTVVFFIAFIMGTQGEFKKSLMATSVISFLISIFLGAMELVPPAAIYITLVAMAASIGFSWLKN